MRTAKIGTDLRLAVIKGASFSCKRRGWGIESWSPVSTQISPLPSLSHYFCLAIKLIISFFLKRNCYKQRISRFRKTANFSLYHVTRQVFPFLLFTIKYDYTEINSFMSALSTRIVSDDSICSCRNLRNRYLDHDATCSICCKRDSNLRNGSLTKYTTGILE